MGGNELWISNIGFAILQGLTIKVQQHSTRTLKHCLSCRSVVRALNSVFLHAGPLILDRSIHNASMSRPIEFDRTLHLL
jgi:hypothetical protein